MLFLITHFLLRINEAVENLVSEDLEYSVGVLLLHFLGDYVVGLKSLIHVFLLGVLQLIRDKAQSITPHRHGAEHLRPVDINESNESNIQFHMRMKLVLNILVGDPENVENYSTNLKIKALVGIAV